MPSTQSHRRISWLFGAFIAAVFFLSVTLLKGNVQGTVIGTSTGTKPVVDLWLSQVSVDENQDIHYTLQNIGKTTVAASSVSVWFEWEDSAGVSHLILGVGSNEDIVPGVTVFPEYLNLSPGAIPQEAQKIIVRVDPNNTLRETNERNNEWEVPMARSSTPPAASSSSEDSGTPTQPPAPSSSPESTVVPGFTVTPSYSPSATIKSKSIKMPFPSTLKQRQSSSARTQSKINTLPLSKSKSSIANPLRRKK